MSINSLQLLPQSPETQLPNHLKFAKALSLIKFFIQHLTDTFEAFFIKNQLHEFDPHVGETSCQIRAYQVLLLASNLRGIDILNIRKKIDALKLLSKKVEQDIAYYQEIDSAKRDRKSGYITLANFLQCNGYCFELNEMELFLLQARLLTSYKCLSLLGEPEIDYDKLSSDLGVSKNTSRKLVHLYQIRLSEVSCEFVASLINQLPKPPITPQMLNLLKLKDDDGRSVLPCFVVMKIIFAHMCNLQKKLLFVIERKLEDKTIDKLYLPFIAGKPYRQNVPNNNLLKQDVYVIEGTINYKWSTVETKEKLVKRLLNIGLEKVIFLNMAIHPQYSGRKLSTFSINPFTLINKDIFPTANQYLENEFLMLRDQASNLGCSLSNASLLYIKHIFCDKMIMQHIPLEENECSYQKLLYQNQKLIDYNVVRKGIQATNV